MRSTTKATAMGWVLLCFGLCAGCDGHVVVGAIDGGGGEGDGGAEGEGESECIPGPIGEPLGCDFHCNDPEAPDFRLSHLDWTTPLGLTNPVVESVANGALNGEETVWLLDTRAGGGFTMGEGRCDDAQPSQCWFEGLLPAVGTWSYDSEGGAFRLPADGDVDLGVSLSTQFSCDEFSLSLPLRSLTLTGFVSPDANCIGSRTGDFQWDTGGVLTAKISVLDAMSVEFGPPGHGSLCDQMSGGAYSNCEVNPDTTSWDNPPDTDVDGEPAWTVTADFAAIGVVIQHCRDGCPVAGETACHDDVVETCTQGVDGCLGWVEGELCSVGLSCNDTPEGSACTCGDCRADEARCEGSVEQNCAQDEEGCLQWVDGDDCDAIGLVCEDGECHRPHNDGC